MKKSKVITNFVCQECGYDTTSWLGKCPECGNWNSLKEFKSHKSKIINPGGGLNLANTDTKPQKLSEIVYQESSRIQTGYSEMDTVIGGGIVKGSVTLIAGDPGVGKSTLLLQVLIKLAKTKKVLYVSGEESVEQIKLRSNRISGIQRSSKDKVKVSAQDDNLLLYAETKTDRITEQIQEILPDLVVVDSIQTLESENTSGLSGSIAQIRYSALQLVRVAKQFGVPIVIVGHVTKEGMVAGPMILSHMVDTVLFLEGERDGETRILRSFKNRFGPVDEVGVFIMNESGITDSANPEKLFLTSGEQSAPGSVRVVTLEGSRAFVIEIQALVVSSRLPMPRRVVSGLEERRVELLLAVLQKHVRLPVDSMDVFVNVAGGIKISDRAIDLGVCLAVYSSLKNILLTNVVGIAEIGLMGELRKVSNLEKRIKEAQKIGFKNIKSVKTDKTLKDVIVSLNKHYGK